MPLPAYYLMVAKDADTAPYIVRGGLDCMMVLKALCDRLKAPYRELGEGEARKALRMTIDGCGVGVYLADDVNVIIDSARMDLANEKAIAMTRDIGFSVMTHPVGI